MASITPSSALVSSLALKSSPDLSSSASVSSTKSFHSTHHVGLKSVLKRGNIRSAYNSGNPGSEVSRESVVAAFQQKRAFKVISGLNNFDFANVASVVSAAEKGGATHVDIACDAELVRMARDLTNLPICVSGIEPQEFLAAVEAGASMVEIGNFDSFYSQGRVFSESEVIALTRETRRLLPDTVLSVTVPHTLPLDAQVRLAEELEKLGADIIQTEGGTSSAPLQPGVHGLIEKASPTLAAAYSISRAVSIPVMCASGLSSVTVPMALACGAAGVGIGSAINKLNDAVAMVAAVRSISDSIDSATSVNQVQVNGSKIH